MLFETNYLRVVSLLRFYLVTFIRPKVVTLLRF